MENILFVSSNNDDRLLPELIRSCSGDGMMTLTNGSEARRRLYGGDFDLIVINCPLQDEFGDDLALMAVEGTSAGVLLVVNAAMEDEVASKVEDSGILVIGKPVNYQVFYQVYKLLIATGKRIQDLKEENRRLKQKMEELKVIDRAKCILIQEMHIKEKEAHHYIEKQAMDFRRSKKEVAEGILRSLG